MRGRVLALVADIRRRTKLSFEADCTIFPDTFVFQKGGKLILIPDSSFKFIAGSSRTGLSPQTASVTIAEINGKVLGTNCFVTATVTGSIGSIVVNSLAGNNLIFESQIANSNFHYIIMYI